MSFKDYCCSQCLVGGRFTEPGYRFYEFFATKHGACWCATHIIAGLVVYPIAFVGFLLGSILNIGGVPYLRWKNSQSMAYYREWYAHHANGPQAGPMHGIVVDIGGKHFVIRQNTDADATRTYFEMIERRIVEDYSNRFRHYEPHFTLAIYEPLASYEQEGNG